MRPRGGGGNTLIGEKVWFHGGWHFQISIENQKKGKFYVQGEPRRAWKSERRANLLSWKFKCKTVRRLGGERKKCMKSGESSQGVRAKGGNEVSKGGKDRGPDRGRNLNRRKPPEPSS